jgi:DNA-binding HxlR family transcriptional regulator
MGDQARFEKELKHPLTTQIVVLLKERAKDGLSNAEIDSALGTASQWIIYSRLRKLVELGIIEYDIQLFGEAGKYHLTQKGLSVLEHMKTTD